MQNYILSRFLYFFKKGNKLIVYSCKTCEIAELDLNNTSSKVMDIEYRTANFINDLKNPLQVIHNNSIFVSNTLDEIDLEQKKYLNTINSNKSIVFGITPTMKCNYSCTYCFQKNIKEKNHMTAKTQSELINFYKEHIKNTEDIHIEWFGGEPLTGFSILINLSNSFIDIAVQCDKKYSASIITNGHLLSKKKIDSFNKLRINKIQVTLDGLPTTFAKRKSISLINANHHYEHIFNMLFLMLEKSINVYLRINVDRRNAHELYWIIDELQKRGLKYTNLKLGLGWIKGDNTLADCLDQEILTTSEFEMLENEFILYCLNSGFTTDIKPSLIDYPCIAVKSNSYMIDSDGDIYKCAPLTGLKENSIGNVNNFENIRKVSDSNWYIKFDPYENLNCKNCEFIPICMGACPRMHNQEYQKECPLKRRFKNRINRYYDNMMHM
ncbi:radical SAM protein [Bacteroidota bacterium]